jgi:hypothetical protein
VVEPWLHAERPNDGQALERSREGGVHRGSV